MFGSPITTATLISSNVDKYIVVINLNNLLAKSIDKCWISDDTGKITKLSEVDYSTLFDYLTDANAPEGAFTWDKENLYIYFQGTYDNSTSYFVSGQRSAIPINSLEDNIDVSEEDIELFLKYAIKEAAQLQGKLVPASVERDIAMLENKYLEE